MRARRLEKCPDLPSFWTNVCGIPGYNIHTSYINMEKVRACLPLKFEVSQHLEHPSRRGHTGSALPGELGTSGTIC